MLIGICFSVLSAGQVYKYKNEKGKWVFTDKKPSEDKPVEELEFQAQKKDSFGPQFYYLKNKDQYTLEARNPFHAPVEIEVESDFLGGGRTTVVVPASGTGVIGKGVERKAFRYRWVMGDPTIEIDKQAQIYARPSRVKRKLRISQSFRGSFSHSLQPSMYAVDVAMEVGTYITAARPGTVVWVKDDYHMGGRDKFFLDKANYVSVVHDDGTIAYYVHILLGSAQVKPGDKVAVGQNLARAGSSGYSTGPHLHFVVKQNIGMKSESIPFVFLDDKGGRYTPRRGMEI